MKRIPFVGNPRNSGFTAIELLITIVIAAILLSLALPNLRVFVQNNRLKTEASEFFAAINLARTEAKAQAARVGICVSANQTGCTGTAWSQGWLVWVDDNANSAVNAGERILRARPGPDNGIALSTAGGTSLSFLADGSVADGNNKTFDICDDTRSGEKGRTITILAASGFARLVDKVDACS